MRGRRSSDDLQYDPEIERTTRANRKIVRLSKSVPPSVQEQLLSPALTETETSTSPEASIMGDPAPIPKLGDYGLATHRGQLTHTFQLANLVAFDIKTTVLNGLRDKQYDGTENMSPYEHLSRFAETCEFCVPPTTVTDSQKKLRLFPFTLTGRARDWLLTIPSGTIQIWDELELRFLEKYFPMSKYWDKKMEIHAIYYASKVLNENQVNYSTTKKETTLIWYYYHSIMVLRPLKYGVSTILTFKFSKLSIWYYNHSNMVLPPFLLK